MAYFLQVKSVTKTFGVFLLSLFPSVIDSSTALEYEIFNVTQIMDFPSMLKVSLQSKALQVHIDFSTDVHIIPKYCRELNLFLREMLLSLELVYTRKLMCILLSSF